MRASRSIPALLLLLAVAGGLFAMHTLGHAGMPGAGAMPEHGKVTAQPMSMGPSNLGLPSIVVAGVPTPVDMPMGVLTICVAILGGLGVLAVISLLSRRRCGLWPPAGSDGVTLLAEAVRGPPETCRGLALAELSVSRN